MATADQPLAVGAPGHAIGHARVSLQHAEQLATGRIPELHGFVVTTAGQSFAEAKKRQRIRIDAS